MYKLVSHPRFGTTWMARYIHRYNLDNGMSEPFRGAPSLEFLNDRFYDVCKLNNFDVPNFTWEEKVQFLEDERVKGIEHCYKVHAYSIKDVEWFNEFYKDWNVIKLDRKDLWRAFLSYQVMSSLQWDPFACHNQTIIENKINMFEIPLEKIDYWFKDYITLEKIKGVKIYYEDLNDDQLIGMFGKTQPLQKITMDYEVYVKNLDEIRTEFHNKYNNVYLNLLPSRQDLHSV